MKKTYRITTIILTAAILLGGIAVPSQDIQVAEKKKVSINKNMKAIWYTL